MRSLAQGLVVCSLIAGFSTVASAQATKTVPPPAKPATKPDTKTTPKMEPKTEGKTPAGFRTLTGTIADIQAGGQLLTLQLPEAGTKGARAAQNWTLGLGKQTLVLRAGKNGQFSTIEMDALTKGETVQVVAELEADAEKTHRAWWLIAYPAGTTPAPR